MVLNKVRRFLLQATLLVVVLLCSFRAVAQKTDTLFHRNGNVLTGEIKKYDHGLLHFKMDGMGTILVENQEINSLISDKFLRIITDDRRIFYGDLDSSSIPGNVRIGLLDYRETFSFSEIVEIYPISKTFWLRVSGNLDLGLDYSKSNKLFRIYGSGDIQYRKEKWAGNLYYYSMDTYQKLDSSIQTSKTDLEFSVEHLVSSTWRSTGAIGVNRNSELGLVSRIYMSLSMKHYIFQTNFNSLYVDMGLSANQEESSEEELSTNFELVLGADYSIFKFSRPEVDLSTFAYVYPNLEFNGRWRFDSGFDFKVEIFDNFFFVLQAYYQYDSQPAAESASNDDWGFTTGVGYKFN